MKLTERFVKVQGNSSLVGIVYVNGQLCQNIQQNKKKVTTDCVFASYELEVVLVKDQIIEIALPVD